MLALNQGFSWTKSTMASTFAPIYRATCSGTIARIGTKLTIFFSKKLVSMIRASSPPPATHIGPLYYTYILACAFIYLVFVPEGTARNLRLGSSYASTPSSFCTVVDSLARERALPKLQLACYWMSFVGKNESVLPRTRVHAVPGKRSAKLRRNYQRLSRF